MIISAKIADVVAYGRKGTHKNNQKRTTRWDLGGRRKKWAAAVLRVPSGVLCTVFGPSTPHLALVGGHEAAASFGL
jgi:hypothetical protein